MDRRLMFRIICVSFLVGLNIVLGSYFLSEFKYPLPSYATQLLSRFKLIPENYYVEDPIANLQKTDLLAQSIVTGMNIERQKQSLPELSENPKLTEAAQLLFDEYKSKQFLAGDVDEQALERSLKQSKYAYSWVGNNIIIGPVSNEQVIEAILGDKEQKDTILNADFSEIGTVASIEMVNNTEIGVVIQLVAQPRKESAAQKKVVTSAPKIASIAKEIPDNEVIDALNAYRNTHGVAPLSTDQHLCTYAEKRVLDLQAFGSLDNHEGFRRDFQDPSNPPAAINAYSGNNIGENLAHQFCKNMTTGESMIAETGIALIEWCFDSSTKGHREAQLSKDFKNVCVRHGDNMYVVIFGN